MAHFAKPSGMIQQSQMRDICHSSIGSLRFRPVRAVVDFWRIGNYFNTIKVFLGKINKSSKLFPSSGYRFQPERVKTLRLSEFSMNCLESAVKVVGNLYLHKSTVPDF